MLLGGLTQQGVLHVVGCLGFLNVLPKQISEGIPILVFYQLIGIIEIPNFKIFQFWGNFILDNACKF